MEQEYELKRCLASKYKLANIDYTDQGTRYTCVECPTSYFDKEQLEIHLCTHFREFRFLCGICGTGLKRKEHLDRHTLGHQEVRPHVCEECGKGFKRKEHLNIHRSIHSGDKSHLCGLCHRSFYRKDHLQKHLQTHSKVFTEDQNMPNVEAEFVDIKQETDCSQSGDDLECEVSLEIDEESNSQSQPEKPPKDPNRPFECCICFKTYKRKDHLKLHSVTHLEKDKICSECGKAFHREEQLLIHMHTHLKPYEEQSVVKQEPAFDVQAMFDHTEIDILPLDMDESSLLIPRVEYGPSPPESSAASALRPHECSICHRRFKRKQHLKVHANVHKRLAPTIWCSLCNEGFVNNDQFESHQCPGSAMDESEEYPEHTGTDEHTVNTHDAKKENHPQFGLQKIPLQQLDHSLVVQERDIPQPQKVYVCKYCNKPFRRKDHYKIHLHIHTGVRSFFCPHCGKGFYRKDHLQKHLQVHTKIRSTPSSLSSPSYPAIPISLSPNVATPARLKKQLPALFPINMLAKKEGQDVSKREVRPEITITAPSNSALRVPLQIKVPYQVVMSMDNGEQRSVTVDPSAHQTLVA